MLGANCKKHKNPFTLTWDVYFNDVLQNWNRLLVECRKLDHSITQSQKQDDPHSMLHVSTNTKQSSTRRKMRTFRDNRTTVFEAVTHCVTYAQVSCHRGRATLYVAGNFANSVKITHDHSKLAYIVECSVCYSYSLVTMYVSFTIFNVENAVLVMSLLLLQWVLN